MTLLLAYQMPIIRTFLAVRGPRSAQQGKMGSGLVGTHYQPQVNNLDGRYRSRSAKGQWSRYASAIYIGI
jgi:hypothetical protein